MIVIKHLRLLIILFPVLSKASAETLTLQASEVESVRWFPLEEIAAEIRTRQDRICVSEQGLQMLTDFLRNEQKTSGMKNYEKPGGRLAARFSLR